MSKLLAEARTCANDRRRAGGANRGEDGNERVDLLGALGDLFLLTSVRAITCPADALERAKRLLFVNAAGNEVEGADIEFGPESEVRGLDAKTFSCMQGYRFFAINRAKHLAIRGRCSVYFALIVPQYAKTGILSLVPYGDVDNWKRDCLIGRAHADNQCIKLIGMRAKRLGRALSSEERSELASKVMSGLESMNLEIGDFLRRYGGIADGQSALQQLKQPENLYSDREMKDELSRGEDDLDSARAHLIRGVPSIRAFLPPLTIDFRQAGQ